MRLARIRIGGLFAAVSLLVACGSDGDEAADTTTAASAVATTASATTDAPATTDAGTTEATSATDAAALDDPALVTSSSAATTTSSVATTATTATTVALPVPIPVPPDSGSEEPIIEVGSIEIPDLDVAETMYEGIRLTTLDRGPGHWPGTAMPGEVGNVVIAGHRVSHSKPFRKVDQLEAGDEIIFNTDAGRFVYTVVSQEIVQPNALWIVDQTPEKTATIFACHPPGSTRERIVVHLVLDESQTALA
jgi:sortase A